MTWGPPTNYRVSSALKNFSFMVDLSSQKPVILMGGGILDFLKGFLRVTKDCYRRVTCIRCLLYGNL